jgi:hypothetical protein
MQSPEPGHPGWAQQVPGSWSVDVEHGVELGGRELDAA